MPFIQKQNHNVQHKNDFDTFLDIKLQSLEIHVSLFMHYDQQIFLPVLLAHMFSSSAHTATRCGSYVPFEMLLQTNEGKTIYAYMSTKHAHWFLFQRNHNQSDKSSMT